MDTTGAPAHHKKTSRSLEKTQNAANSFYDVEIFNCLLVKMCEEIYLIHTRAKLKWDWMPVVTNSGRFITGMPRELIAVQLPDLCTTACRHILLFYFPLTWRNDQLLAEDAGELSLPSLPLPLVFGVEEARGPMRGIRRIGRQGRPRGVSALQQLIMKVGMVLL